MTLTLISNQKCFGGSQKKFQHFSNVLNCEMIFSLFLPENSQNKPTSLIWWLSGLTCTDDNFSQKSGFQRIANELNLAVAIPDTSPRGAEVADDESWDLGKGAGFYLDATEEPWKRNYQMYSYLTEELPLLIHKEIPNFSGKESIMGHSMGGHGALVLGLKNPERFLSISAFAPILSPSHVPWGEKAFTAYLGKNKETWKEWDATELVQKIEPQPILIAQGSADDFLKEQLQADRFSQVISTQSSWNYQMKEGYDHSYFFIASFLEEHFRFHADYLK